ncbi:MAG: hypothetical protein JSU04_15530 [Bdellovibrionales bacterium]|nr:hypothetical protein [Bdellovibrionales bacterium]
MKSLVVFCTFLTLTRGAFAAETPLQLSSKISTIHGVVEGGAKVDTLAFYVPAGKLDPSKSLANCTFPEDKYSPNEAGKFMKITVAQSTGEYSIALPMAGIRGKCEYVLDTAYVNFDNGKVYESLSILTKAKVDHDNKDLISAGLAPMDVPSLSSLQKLFCEFNTPDSVGLCQTTDGFLPEINYEMTNEPAGYVLDVEQLKSESF